MLDNGRVELADLGIRVGGRRLGNNKEERHVDLALAEKTRRLLLLLLLLTT